MKERNQVLRGSLRRRFPTEHITRIPMPNPLYAVDEEGNVLTPDQPPTIETYVQERVVYRHRYPNRQQRRRASYLAKLERRKS